MLQADSQAAFTALVVAKYDDMLLSNFCSVAATTLLFYDYILTFPQEVQCIWGRKFTGATVLFLLNRYLTLGYRVLMLVDMLPWQNLPVNTADNVRVLHTTQGLTIISQLVIAAFTSLRMYAIWNGDRRILLAVLLLGLVPSGVNIYYYTTVTIVSAPPPFLGCGEYVNLSPAAADIIFNCVFAIASDGIVLILTWIKTIGISQSFTKIKRKGSLVSLIQRDGTLYFFSLLVLNVINLVAIKFQAFGCLPALTEVLTSIFVSRFFLNLRGVYLSPGSSKGSSSSLRLSQMSSVRFASSIAGNLGAPLGEVLTHSEERSDPTTGDQEDVAYISGDPLAVGLCSDIDEEEPGYPKLKDLYDSDV